MSAAAIAGSTDVDERMKQLLMLLFRCSDEGAGRWWRWVQVAVKSAHHHAANTASGSSRRGSIQRLSLLSVVVVNSVFLTLL